MPPSEAERRETGIAKNHVDRRKFLLAAGATAASLNVAGCTGNNNQGGGTDGTTEGTTAGSGKPQRATIHLVSDASSSRGKKALRNAFDNWADTVDANVERQFEFLGFDAMIEKLNTYFGTGNPPDAVYGAYGGFAQFFAAGLMTDVTDFVNEELPSISEGWLNEVRFNGKVQGIPAFADFQSAWIRQDLYEEYGLEPAVTYEEQRENVKILDENLPDGTKPIHIIANPNDGATQYANDDWFLPNEAYWCRRDSQEEPPEILIDKEPQRSRAIESLSLLKEMYQYSADTLNHSYGELINTFVSEKVAKTQFSGRILINLHEQAPDLVDSIKRVDHPTGKEGRQYLAHRSPQVWGVTAGSDIQDLTLDFVRHFMTSESYIDLALANPLHDVPARANAMDEPKYKNNEIVQAHPDVLEYNKTAGDRHVSTISRSSILGSMKTSYWKTAVRGSEMITPKMYASAITGRKSPEKAVDDAGEALRSRVETLQQRLEESMSS